MERSLDYKGKNDVVAAGLQVREFRVEARFYAFLDLLREPGIPRAGEHAVQRGETVQQRTAHFCGVLAGIVEKFVQTLYFGKNIVDHLVLHLVGEGVDVRVMKIERRLVDLCLVAQFVDCDLFYRFFPAKLQKSGFDRSTGFLNS